MEFELILKIGDKDGAVSSVSLGQICRSKVDDVALLGLELSESKQVLRRLQHEIVTTQFKSISHDRGPCACCAAVGGGPKARIDGGQARFCMESHARAGIQ